MMNIFYLDNKNIDKVKWDECIKNAPNGNVYAYSWYLDIVCKNWSALVTEDYSCVFPLTWRKKMGIKYLFQPPFAQQLGLFSKSPVESEHIEFFLNAIPKEFSFIEINLNKFNIRIPDTFSQIENVTYELDLNYPYNDINKEFSENTRRNIKKSLKNDISLSKNICAEEMINLFKKNRGKNIKTLQEGDYIILQKLINQSINSNCGEMWGAYDNFNALCAAAFFIEGNNKKVFLFSALNDKGRNNSAMFSIIDNFIRLNACKPFALDFEGSNDEKIAHFYKGFGAKKHLYFHINSNNLPYLVNLFRGFYKKLKFN